MASATCTDFVHFRDRSPPYDDCPEDAVGRVSALQLQKYKQYIKAARKENLRGAELVRRVMADFPPEVSMIIFGYMARLCYGAHSVGCKDHGSLRMLARNAVAREPKLAFKEWWQTLRAVTEEATLKNIIVKHDLFWPQPGKRRMEYVPYPVGLIERRHQIRHLHLVITLPKTGYPNELWVAQKMLPRLKEALPNLRSLAITVEMWEHFKLMRRLPERGELTAHNLVESMITTLRELEVEDRRVTFETSDNGREVNGRDRRKPSPSEEDMEVLLPSDCLQAVARKVVHNCGIEMCL
ncbi:hypothetical protein LTR36_004824 [Oleoguttula mirabilis]|uniref:Uncharacterized protein n=1 Tax=Oleoguttula mirabilis TaxID=1507867 RepID=A0AAV9JF20_9PEZI|nr:hypothetical protein LTR36_004824 [Oleoguttula mirabilis]